MPNNDQSRSSNTFNHQCNRDIFSRQPDTRLVQVLPTSSHVRSDTRTYALHPARQTRISALNAASGFSRASSRLTADPAGEWPIHPTHNGHSSTINIRTRPDSVPTQTRLSESNEHRDAHQRQAATLVQFDPTTNNAPRISSQRPDTESQIYTSGGSPGRGALHIDPDNSRKAFTQQQRPRGGVWQDKGALTIAPSASPQPGAVEKGERSRFVNKDSPRSQNITHLQSRVQGRVKLIHTSFWLPPWLREELQRIAACEHLPLSQVGAIGLGEWARQRLHKQHEDTLYPVLRQLIRDELRAFGNRIIFFLMRIAFAAEQSRILITNVLHKMIIQMGLPIDKFNALVDQSNKMARRNIITRAPEIKRLMEEWEASSEAEKDNDKSNSNRKEKN